MDLQQRQMQDAVAAATMAAQAAAQAVAALAEQMTRPTVPVGAEGADRAGSGVVAPTPPAQTPIIASSSPTLGKLTSDETKSIMASTKGFEAKVRKLLKCNAKVDKGKSDLQIFAQDTTGTRYPAGVRPFRSAAEMVELDSTLSQCKERDWVFMVTIPVGTSRRTALQKLHREHAMFVRSTDVEALEEQQSTLRGVASLAHFREKCTTALREARAERDNNTARLDFPVRTETAECVLTERIESEYRNLFDRMNKELRAEKKRADDKSGGTPSLHEVHIDSFPFCLNRKSNTLASQGSQDARTNTPAQTILGGNCCPFPGSSSNFQTLSMCRRLFLF